jgi:hypothetical protein
MRWYVSLVDASEGSVGSLRIPEPKKGGIGGEVVGCDVCEYKVGALEPKRIPVNPSTVCIVPFPSNVIA